MPVGRPENLHTLLTSPVTNKPTQASIFIDSNTIKKKKKPITELLLQNFKKTLSQKSNRAHSCGCQ